MGCSASKVKQDEEAPAALRPVQRKIEEIKKRRRVRKDSISDAELLRPEEMDVDPTMTTDEALPAPVIKEVDVVAEEVVKDVKMVEVEGEQLVVPQQEEVPGSPSFRFYFTGTPVHDSDDDSFRGGHVTNKEEKCEEKKADNIRERGDSNESLTSNEDLEVKGMKKGKMFRGFKRARLSLNVRSCYHTAPNVHESPRLLVGRAA